VNPDAPYDLNRFLDAQGRDYETALRELQSGRKQSHWIWYIFPQVAGLGRSMMSRRYAIRSAGEAKAYLDHPILGPRLRQCAAALLAHADKPIEDIMGYPDDLKARSSMTLFAAVSSAGSVFHRVLDHFYSGRQDEATVAFLKGNP